VDIVNGYRTNVTINGFKYITSTSTTPTTVNPISGSSTTNLMPGAKHSVVLLVPSNTKAIIIEYRARSQSLVETVTIG
jgi:hypothetical protein